MGICEGIFMVVDPVGVCEGIFMVVDPPGYL